ncbi:MAG: peptide chain release factor N(5)-glutamine methyltransferase [Clostridia bacterium]|nr:peptide chain release factor N(5)-glutamine methyltransferase [Clostridia bacterium]
MQKTLKALWEGSQFAKENLSFRETAALILEKYSLERDTLLLGKEIPQEISEKIISDMKRAVSGEPLGYILGKVPFYKEEYLVGEGVLIPRCDSEVLVEEAIKRIPEGTRFLDICTGSGCLGISVLKSRPDLTAALLDISPFSERWAKANIEYHGVSDRCTFEHFDLMKEVPPKASAIIMNPPYITTEEMNTLPENVKKEPSLALFGGDDGLDFYRRIKSLELKDTLLIFEIGAGQGEALKTLFHGGEIIKDLSNNNRVFIHTNQP